MTENCPWSASYPCDVPHEINPDCFDSIPAVLDSVANEFPYRVAYSNIGVGLTYRRTV